MDKKEVIVVLLSIIALVAAGVVLKAAKGVILPFVIAWLLSYLFAPIVRFLVKKKVPTIITTIAVLGIFIGVCSLSILFLNTRIMAFAREYPRYYSQLIDIAKSLTANVDLPPDFWSQINWGQRAGIYLYNFTGSLVSFFSNLILVIIFLVFLLSGSPYFNYKIKKAFSEENSKKVTRIISSISRQISRYLSMQFLISLVTGVMVWAALWLMDVDFAITWGVFAFILNFIPTIGSVIASIPPILVAVVQFYPDFFPAFLVGIQLFIIQQTMGNIVSPKVMGDELNLSPVVILISLLFWGWLWGVMGALLSVPILAAIKIVCDNVESLHVLSVMMGSGRTYSREMSG